MELVRSKEGSLVAGYCVGYADAGVRILNIFFQAKRFTVILHSRNSCLQERKRAIKALKNDVVNVAKEEHGHMLILKYLFSLALRPLLVFSRNNAFCAAMTLAQDAREHR